MGKLLIIADLDGQCAATPRGLELARRLGHAAEVVAFTWARLKGLNVDASARAGIRQRLLNERETEVEDRIARYRDPAQKVSLKVVWEKDIVPWILRRTAGGKYDVVVKTGSRTESVIHTPTDWHLLRDCEAPVMIVSRDKWLRTKPVLAAVDLAARSKEKRSLNLAVVESAQRVASALDASLKLIAAVEVPVLLSDLDMVDPVAYVKGQKLAMQPRLEELLATYDLPRNAVRIKRGPVARVITSEAARLRAQLVVMGTVGRKGVKARLLGNTAESVLQLLHTDVLALKP